jgi:hypothetical protein
MGNFRLELELIGGHGCQRDRKDGDEVYGCRSQHCPDCRIREFVEDMSRRYTMVEAKLKHWPGTTTEVVDDLVSKKRHGNF